ncbi:MAG TPA: hypothetical protein VHZ51_28955 [Ktedonobacteraceae bacterium]|jgi:hypothetical protein|nr:hypothetical protein [Ktedonobacteraceae bacterium]
MNTAEPVTISNTNQNWWTRLWRSQTMTIARFTLMSHVRSGWILGDIVAIWIIYAVFFVSNGGDTTYFYGTAGPAMGVLAVLGTIVMTKRATRAQMYLPLAKLGSRTAYVHGLMLASGFLRLPIFMLTLLLAAGYHHYSPGLGIKGATFANLLPGAIGVILYCVLLAVLTYGQPGSVR